MPVLPYLDHQPALGERVRLAEGAFAIGAVRIAGPAQLEELAVVRGDQNAIAVGPRFHLGRRSTVHVDLTAPTRIGQDVWVGDDAVVHGCTLGDQVRVEDGALVLSGSTVGAGSVVAADSLVPEGATFPDNSYVAGTPGRRLRETTPEERATTRHMVEQALG